jgi:putative peptidoglycan lipid II flippase
VTTPNLARAGLTVFGAFLASRILGWVRVVVLVRLFGNPAQIGDLDAYNAAFRIPDLIYQLVAAGAIASALVPVLSGLLGGGEKQRAWRVASAVASVVLVALSAAALLMFIFAPVIVPMLVSGFDAEKTAKTIELTRMMLLSPIFLALGAVASSVLNTQGRFGAAAMAPVVYNAAIIVFAIALAPIIGIDGAAIGVVVGSVLHFAIQLPSLRGHFTWTFQVRSRDPAAHEALMLMVPRAIGLGASQVAFIVNTSLASAVLVAGLGGDGAVSVYNVAFNVLQIPLGILAVPVGIVLLPSLSRARLSVEDGQFAAMVGQSVRLLLWMTLFLAAVGLVLREQSLALLFPGFAQPAVQATAATLGVFLLGLPAHAINVILARAFYAGRDTRTPVAVAVASVAVNITVSVLTVGSLGLLGLALGIALGGWFESISLMLILHRRVPSFELRPMLRALTFLVGAAIAAAIAFATVTAVERLDLLGSSYAESLLEVLVAGLSAGAGYLLYSRLVHLPELPRAIGLFRSALRRG